jgi:hypothetical protein
LLAALAIHLPVFGFVKARRKECFLYFPICGPTEAYFDKSWPLPDIEDVK